jgi:hypothetical protein
MKRLNTLVLQYYRTLLVYNISFTLLCFVITGLGASFNPVVMFFCKLIGFIAASGLHYYSAANTYFYYRNAGINIKRLFTYACMADALASLLFIIPFTIISNLLHAASQVKG